MLLVQYKLLKTCSCSLIEMIKIYHIIKLSVRDSK